MRQIYGDLLATFWLPTLAGSVMAAITWLVWFYSGAPASAFGGAGADAMPLPGPLAPYLNLEILHYCYVHATVAVTLTGGSDFMLFIRESRRNQRAEQASEERRQQERAEAQERYEREQDRAERMLNMVQTALEQAHEERRLAEERAAEERRLAEERYRLAEERYRQHQERYRQDQQRAEERADARAEADRQAFVSILTQFSTALARNGNDDTSRQTEA